MTNLARTSFSVLHWDPSRELRSLAQIAEQWPALRPLTLLLTAEVRYAPHRVAYMSLVRLPSDKVAVQISHPTEVTVIETEDSFSLPPSNGWAEPRVYEGVILRSWNKIFKGPIVASQLASILGEALNDIALTYGRLDSEKAQVLHITTADAELFTHLGMGKILKSKKVQVVSDDTSYLLPSLNQIAMREFGVSSTPQFAMESLNLGALLRCSTTHRGLPLALFAVFKDAMSNLDQVFTWTGSDFLEVDRAQVRAESLTPISEELATHIWGSNIRKFWGLKRSRGEIV